MLNKHSQVQEVVVYGPYQKGPAPVKIIMFPVTKDRPGFALKLPGGLLKQVSENIGGIK